MSTRSGRVQSPSASVGSRTLREALVAGLQRRELMTGYDAALLSARSATRSPRPWDLTSYGMGDAEALVLDRVREWERRGGPTESELAVDATYDGDRSRLTVRWPTVP